MLLSSILNSIFQTYSQNLDKLSILNRAHFVDRYFKVSNNLIQKEALQLEIVERLDYLDRYIKNPKDSTLNYVEGALRKYQVEDKEQYIRFKRRENFYKKNPEAWVLTSLIWCYYRAHHLSNDVSKIKKYSELVNSIAKNEQILSKEHLFNNPVKQINIIYSLMNLGILDKTDVLIEMYRSLLSNNEFNLIDRLYSLTHFLIGHSNFFQHYPNSEDQTRYKWIIDELTEKIKLISTNTNIDIIYETGICLKMFNSINDEVSSIIDKYTLDHFNPEIGLVTEGNSDSLSDLEHSNVLILLYYKMGNNFYKLPQINI